MTTELAKTFDPAAIEARWYAHWEQHGLFRPARPEAEPFTIVNPPPNVTGSLHIGHALDNTLQDIVVRYERLRGKDALWVVGTDHAGIATQMVVERQLEAAGDKRTNHSREEFIAKVWEWKEESGGTITGQLRRLGCSMDWSREQFTMDPHFTAAVTRAFVDLYDAGLIYRDKRLVNWDPILGTAISDLEVETREVQGHFWHLRYPLADGSGHIEVSTTRPKTMLADMAVAVHPDDERYIHLIGKLVKLPITGRLIPIVADNHADPQLGTGAVKITPGHDFSDFEVGKRVGINPSSMLNMLDSNACISQTADGLVPGSLIGLSRDEGVDAVVQLLEAEGALIGKEERTIQLPHGDRSAAVIEPWLTDQWYVDAEKLAAAPIEAVRSGAVEIVPRTWEKTFFNWMENIQPWCVSRQLWWGHRIPAWYGPLASDDGLKFFDDPQAVRENDQGGMFVFVEADDNSAIEAARKLYSGLDWSNFDSFAKIEIFDDLGSAKQAHEDNPEILPIWRDQDVLDTWFSSALWPFATLGWPDADAELLAKHYPNDLLISGFDILFFWDARMMMMGRHLTGDNPWKRLYLHGLVRAADGAKMSKSKGNVVDPLGLIDRYGADALRFFMAAMESQGRDIKMDEKRVEGYRNFATKLWNAARFCQANGIGASDTIAAPPARLAANQWIIGEVQQTVDALDKALADLRFDAAANTIYHFVWDRFCDWYLELIKPVLQGEGDNPAAAETRAVAGWALDQILVMLHPFMPFVTEELWHAQGGRADYPLITAKWPEPQADVSADAVAAIDWVIALTTATRAARNELGIAPGVKLAAWIEAPSPVAAGVLERASAAVERLARLAPVHVGAAPPGPAMQIGAGSDAVIVPLEGVIDIAAEKARLAKAMDASAKEHGALGKRLANPAFVERANPEAVEKARADHAHHSSEIARLEAALARLG